MKTPDRVEKNHLVDRFWSDNTELQSQTMTRKELKETLLATGGYVFCMGALYDIKNTHLGAGVYKVFLKRRN